MPKITGSINFDALKVDYAKDHHGEKLAFVKHVNGWKAEWLSPEKIQNLQKTGNKLTTSLDTIISIVNSQPIKDVQPQELQTLHDNIDWLQSKAEKYNAKLEKKTFLNIVDHIVRFFTLGRNSLKCEVIKDSFNLIHATKFLNHLPIKDDERESLYKAILFALENREKFLANSIGSQSQSRSDLIKLKKISYKGQRLPFEIHYSKDDGIVICMSTLGEGTFKKVKKYFSLANGELEALGKQQIHKPDHKDFAEQEIKMLKACKGEPNVLQLRSYKTYHSKKKNKEIYLTKTPFCQMGDLNGCMRSLKADEKKKVAVDILKGIIALHNHGIIHRDLKPANILVSKEKVNGVETVRAVVADLGLSSWVDNDASIHIARGSPLYMSPQQLSGNEVASFADDDWGAGCILSLLFTGDLPMNQAQDRAQLDTIVAGMGKTPEPIDKQSVEYVIWSMLQPEEFVRMTSREALQILEA